MIHIGIDPGVVTGYATVEDGILTRVAGCKAIDVEVAVLVMAAHDEIFLFVEDARLRKWVQGGREKLQGVGSVKRDCQRWQEYAEYHGFEIRLIPPKANRTKLTAPEFKRVTGWQGQTNEHGRDAAMLVWGRK